MAPPDTDPWPFALEHLLRSLAPAQNVPQFEFLCVLEFVYFVFLLCFWVFYIKRNGKVGVAKRLTATVSINGCGSSASNALRRGVQCMPPRRPMPFPAVSNGCSGWLGWGRGAKDIENLIGVDPRSERHCTV